MGKKNPFQKMARAAGPEKTFSVKQPARRAKRTLPLQSLIIRSANRTVSEYACKLELDYELLRRTKSLWEQCLPFRPPKYAV